MSYIIEIIVHDVSSLSGLIEVERTWGGERVSVDQPQLLFQQIELVGESIPAHVRAIIPPALATSDSSLVMTGGITAQWRNSGLAEAQRNQLEALFSVVARQPSWAVVCEDTQSDGESVVGCQPRELFQRVRECVEGNERRGLVVFVREQDV